MICDPTELSDDAITEIQDRLLRQGQHIPGMTLQEEHDLARSASSSSSWQLQSNGPAMELKAGIAQMVPGIRFRPSAGRTQPRRVRIELRCSDDRADEHSPQRLIQSWHQDLEPGDNQARIHQQLEDERSCSGASSENAGSGISIHGSAQRGTGLLSLRYNRALDRFRR